MYSQFISVCGTHTIQNALIAADYTVWIDETGIRAGQKWRNEIASGIHVSCFVHKEILLALFTKMGCLVVNVQCRNSTGYIVNLVDIPFSLKQTP